jgi:23S rRNA-/tRNA-specific pseudouridylate synthase
MIKIYYQDKDIVICEKPYGVSSQKSSGDNMVDMLEKELANAENILKEL